MVTTTTRTNFQSFERSTYLRQTMISFVNHASSNVPSLSELRILEKILFHKVFRQ
jgi:hypothetical protein